MKTHPAPRTAAVPTLQTVLDRVTADQGLSEYRRRDLRSALISFGKLSGQPPTAIPLDLADIRRTFAGTRPTRVSAKRLANLRSDLAAAIEASGLRPMLSTARLDLDPVWNRVIAPCSRQVRYGLSRFARWASLRQIPPKKVDIDSINRFVAELGEATLAPRLRHLPRSVAKAWNALVASDSGAGLRPVAVPSTRPAPIRNPWSQLPASLRDELDRYLRWGSVPDPLAHGARAKVLAPRTLRLRAQHIHSAASAAIQSGIPINRLTSLSCLLEPEIFCALLRYLWARDGRTLSAYTAGLALTLITVAQEWVRLPADKIATLKALRSKLGTQPSGLTEKNKTTLRAFDDPRLVSALINLPDKLWTAARRQLPTSRLAFIDLQTALAIDLLVHIPMRLQNLASLNFNRHLHWPQGRRRPALVTFGAEETKNKIPLEFEIPAQLADRLQIYRNEIAPAVIGRRPEVVFVTFSGTPRKSETIKMTLVKTVLNHLGVRITPHQFRHLAAKLMLDANPGAYEPVRQLLGHTSLATTTAFYAGIDTRRAGRAHADLIMKLRESKPERRSRLGAQRAR